MIPGLDSLATALVALLVTIAGAAGIGIAAWWKGVQRERERRDGKDAANERDTLKRMYDALGSADDDAHLRDWLRERGRKPRGDL